MRDSNRYPMRDMALSELLPGDEVTPMGERVSPFDAAIVKSVSDTLVTFFRPYGAHADFVYGQTPSVITYVGMEEHSLERNRTNVRYFVWTRM